MCENYLQHSADENSPRETCETSRNDGKEGIKVPLATRHGDFYLLDLFISCSAGDGSQDIRALLLSYPASPYCDVLKLWLTGGTQGHPKGPVHPETQRCTQIQPSVPWESWRSNRKEGRCWRAFHTGPRNKRTQELGSSFL